MTAFIECRACGKQHTFRDDWKTDSELAADARGLGWSTLPQSTRCPEHVDTVIPHPLECTLGHDVAAFERSLGIMTGGRPVNFNGRRDHFGPRDETCPWMLHYIVDPIEFREHVLVGAAS